MTTQNDTFCQRDCGQNLLLMISEFKQINYFLFPLKLTESHKVSYFRENRS